MQTCLHRQMNAVLLVVGSITLILLLFILFQTPQRLLLTHAKEAARKHNFVTGPSAKHASATQPAAPLLHRGPLEWLHLPKAGTSFGNTLVLWACPELDTDTLWVRADGVRLPASCLSKFRVSSRPNQAIGDHISLTNRTDEELGQVVTMLRYPPARLASLYHHLRAHYAKGPKSMDATEARICSWLLGSPWGAHARGGMVKYVVGVELERDPHLNSYTPAPTLAATPEQAAVREACRRLRLFAFVGITEFWDASVCLFHALHGGVMRPLELQNVREGGYQNHTNAVKAAGCGDTADMQLFECGQELFWRTLDAHPQCSRYLPREAPHGLQWPPGV